MEVTKHQVMNTLFRASEEVTSLFADALVEATDIHTETLNCKPVNKALKFALVNLYCSECDAPHWSVLVKKHEDEFDSEIDGKVVSCTSVCSSFEEAIEQFEALAANKH